MRGSATVVLAAIGLTSCIAAGNDLSSLRLLVLCTVVCFSFIPPINRRIAKFLGRVAQPSARTLEWTGVIVALLATCYLVATAFGQGRELFPKTEDDCSYVLGAQMLARGRLWMSAHPLADFFETFYVTVKPVYCSIYFPGAAMCFAPMAWFHWPAWAIPALISGAAVGLVYRIIAELVDGGAGLLAAVWMVSLRWFRMVSVMAMSHVPMLLLGLLMVWCYLKWKSKKTWTWPLALGIFSGWAAITRPADAIAYAVPIGIGMLFELHRQCARKWVATLAPVVLGAAPFLAIQLVFNLGVTGHGLETPYTAYLRQSQPGTEYGIHRFDQTSEPATTLPAKIAFYQWCKPFMRDHQPSNFLTTWFERRQLVDRTVPSNLVTLVDAIFPSRWIMLAAFAGLVGLHTSGRRILACTLPAFVFVYLFNPFFLQHYAVVVAGAAILLGLLGCSAPADWWPRWSVQCTVASRMAVLTLCVTSLWEVYRYMPSPEAPAGDDMLEAPLLTMVNVALPESVNGRAVVLFRQSPERIHYFVEPVYNFETAWPDDARIIRAHDLFERDGEIIAYYASRQPDRMFYLCDEATGVVTALGSAGELELKLKSGVAVSAIVRSSEPAR